jgi:hypothetical protein
MAVNVRENSEAKTRVLVGMATCGIAAGARPVLTTISDEVNKRELHDVLVTQTGCIGRIALRNCGVINPENIDEYIALRRLQALGKVLTEMTPEDVIDVKASGLRGRGGGGFPHRH